MRIGIALAGFLVVVPAWAEEPQGFMRVETEAVVVASLVQTGLCPEFRVNEARIQELTRVTGMSLNEIQQKYSDYFQKLGRSILASYRSSAEKTCNNVWDIHGPNGTLSHVIERK